MKNAGIWLGKAAIVWLVLVVGQMVGGMAGMAVAHAPMADAVGDGPISGPQAVAVINLIFALVLGAQASNMSLTPWRKAIVLFVILYGVESVLSLIEAVYFGTYLKLPPETYVVAAVTNGIKAAAGAVVAAWLWRSNDPQGFAWPRGLWWKLPVIIPIYIVFYFGAGFLIAWQGEAVRTFYAQGLHIDAGQLALLQVGRALIWGGLGVVSVAALRGTAMRKALLTGLAFAVFMAIALLYPTSFMPWAVRQFHIVEIFTSNFLFGMVTALILLIGGKARAGTEA